MGKVRLLIVDDDSTVRRGLRMRLQLESDLEIAGEADNGRDGVHMARALRPNVVLMDVEMQGMNGIEATSEITRDLPEVAVIVLTMHDDEGTKSKARDAGAFALVPKHLMDSCLLSTIRAAASG